MKLFHFDEMVEHLHRLVTGNPPAPRPLATVTPNPTIKENHMSFLTPILLGAEKLFAGVFDIKSLENSAKAEMTTVENGIITFAKTDLGKLAIDAVNAAQGKFSNDDAAFDGAKAAFLADAKTAGHDLEALGKGVVDWMVQTAYTFTANTAAKIAAAATAAPVPAA